MTSCSNCGKSLVNDARGSKSSTFPKLVVSFSFTAALIIAVIGLVGINGVRTMNNTDQTHSHSLTMLETLNRDLETMAYTYRSMAIFNSPDDMVGLQEILNTTVRNATEKLDMLAAFSQNSETTLMIRAVRDAFTAYTDEVAAFASFVAHTEAAPPHFANHIRAIQVKENTVRVSVYNMSEAFNQIGAGIDTDAAKYYKNISAMLCILIIAGILITISFGCILASYVKKKKVIV